jgi:hypothetical protein
MIPQYVGIEKNADSSHFEIRPSYPEIRSKKKPVEEKEDPKYYEMKITKKIKKT